jgi:membrane protein
VRGALEKVDGFQQRHKPLAIAVAVVKKFSDDGAGGKAALIAYYGFFSLFPLLLLFVTILGFVVGGNSSAERAVLHSALKQFPIVGSQLGTPHALTGNGLALAVGLVGALLSGLGVTTAAQNAFNTVYALPHKRQPNFLVTRWRGLRLLVVVGALQLVSTAASGAVAGGLGGPLLTVAGILVSLLINVVMFLALFRLLADTAVSTHELWPGILLASVAWEILQSLGGIYIGHVVRGSGPTYGTFAVVLGLLVWLYLGARVVVYAAETNVVLTRGLWPRSLLGPPVPADRRARAALAKMEERDDRETVEVTFHPPADDHEDPASPQYSVAPAPEPGEDAHPASWSDR